MAKFCHFGQRLITSGKLLKVDLVFVTFVTYFVKKYVVGEILIVLNGQIWKII